MIKIFGIVLFGGFGLLMSFMLSLGTIVGLFELFNKKDKTPLWEKIFFFMLIASTATYVCWVTYGFFLEQFG